MLFSIQTCKLENVVPCECLCHGWSRICIFYPYRVIFFNGEILVLNLIFFKKKFVKPHEDKENIFFHDTARSIFCITYIPARVVTFIISAPYYRARARSQADIARNLTLCSVVDTMVYFRIQISLRFQKHFIQL